MLFASSKFAAATLVLCATIALSAPLPARPSLGRRAIQPKPQTRSMRRAEAIERLQARTGNSIPAYRRAPQATTLQQFARDDGSNDCITGALDWLLATVLGPDSSSNDTTDAASSDSGSGNSTDSSDLGFIDECIGEVVGWAVAQLLGDPSSGGDSSSAVGAPSAAPSSDPDSDPSGHDPSAPAAAPSSPASAPSASPTDDGSSTDDSDSNTSSRRSLASHFGLDPDTLNSLLGKLLSNISN